MTSAPQRHPRAPVRTYPAERIVGWILFGLLGVLVFIASAFGGLMAMAADACMGGDTCNDGVMTVGWLIAMLSPWAVGLAVLVLMVVRTVTGRSVWWLPLVGAVLVVLGVIAGGGIIELGITEPHEEL